MAKLMPLSQVPRATRGAVIAVVLALVVAAPVAAAAPAAAVTTPMRTVRALSPFTIPAGQACTFDVEGQPSFGFSAKTVFPDGRVMYSVRAHGAYVNPANGARYPTADTFYDLERFDPTTGILVVELDGMAADSFLPGDQGPFGVVGPDPAFYDFVGTISFTYNTITGQTTQFSWSGTVTDICAALS